MKTRPFQAGRFLTGFFAGLEGKSTTAAGEKGTLVREFAMFDDAEIAKIGKKAAPAAPVVSKLSPRQKAKRRMKDKRRAKQPKEGT